MPAKGKLCVIYSINMVSVIFLVRIKDYYEWVMPIHSIEVKNYANKK